jgi:predicted nucleic acid-binding protein
MYLDTNIWIYAITAHPKYGEKCKQILEKLERGS